VALDSEGGYLLENLTEQELAAKGISVDNLNQAKKLAQQIEKENKKRIAALQ